MRISDWSSDVCSSDLPGDAIALVLVESAELELADAAGGVPGEGEDRFGTHRVRLLRQPRGAPPPLAVVATLAPLAHLVLPPDETLARHLAAAPRHHAHPLPAPDQPLARLLSVTPPPPPPPLPP